MPGQPQVPIARRSTLPETREFGSVALYGLRRRSDRVAAQTPALCQRLRSAWSLAPASANPRTQIDVPSFAPAEEGCFDELGASTKAMSVQRQFH
jgi:hypothetical protein